MIRTFLLCLLSGCAAWGAPPVSITVITRYPHLFTGALQGFEARHGKGRIALKTLGSGLACTDLSGAKVIYVHESSWSPQMTACGETARQLESKGVRIGASMGNVTSVYWQVKGSPELAAAAAYVQAGGEANMVNLLAVLHNSAGGASPFPVDPVAKIEENAIYHPNSSGVFSSFKAYEEWYRASGLIPDGAPLVGLTFFRTNYAYRDLAHIDALIAALERRGVGVVSVFAWPMRKAEPFLISDGQPVVKLILAMNLLMGNPDDAVFLNQYGLRAINIATTTEDRATWKASLSGLPSQRLGSQINSPERGGATEPILIATTEKTGTASRLEPLPERIEDAAARAARWIALMTKPNSEKRLAIIYYNNPPGKGTLGASYLNLIPSLAQVLERLHKEGYRTDARPPTGEQLKRLMMMAGRNVGDSAPGELDALVRDGHVALLPMERYQEWYATLPGEFRALTEKTWGRPEQTKSMTLRSGGKAYFIIPGIRIGNIFLGPQPLRGTPDQEAGLQHDPNTPVPHSYIACYLYYRNQFRADALVHMGRHGTVEWLPGKAVAQASSDSGEVMIGDLPNAYYYVVDGGGEFLQSKRRAASVMISHLTPLLVSAGLPAEYNRMRDAIANRERVLSTNEALSRQYELEIVDEARRLKLDSRLDLDLAATPAVKVVERVESFLHDLEAQPIPLGMHTIGAAPDPDGMRQALAKFMESAFEGDEARRARPYLEGWASALVNRADLDGPADLVKKIKDQARTWMTAIEESPSQELLSLIHVLNGRYLPTGVSGDPLRSPAAVPTGRNMHDIDPRAFPTRAAWTVGRRMADQMIRQWVEKNGKHPEKMSFVLWYGEASRHQGIAEAQALAMLGVEPVWNGRGHVDDVKLIPAAQLGRPRVDVILTMSGLYRDGMPEKAMLLDKAVQLAAAAPDDNPVRRNTKRVEQSLVAQGIDPKAARATASARVFGPAPGAFGVGISGMMESSRDQGDRKAVGDAYMSSMGYAYSAAQWGAKVQGGLKEHLKGNQAVIHSRSTNLYGVLDNDDTYQFAGGLSAATTAAGSTEPAVFVSNVRKPGQEKMEEMIITLVLQFLM